MYASAFMCMDMISALAVYYATDVWHGYKLFDLEMSSLFIIAPLMVAAVIMFPIARIMMDKKSKQFAFRMGLPFYIGGGIMLAVMDPSWAPPILVPIVALIMGLGFGGAQMMPWIIFPDTVDVAEMATGKRPTGTYSGMMTLARKIAGALGVGIVGWVIGAAGYIENTSGDASKYIDQPDSALLAIRLVVGIAIAVFIALALFASFKYKITSKKLERIRYFIDARKNGTELTPEEEEERAKLISELYGKVNPDDVVDPSLYDEEGNLIIKDEASSPSLSGEEENLISDISEMQHVESEGIDAVAEAMAVKTEDEDAGTTAVETAVGTDGGDITEEVIAVGTDSEIKEDSSSEETVPADETEE